MTKVKVFLVEDDPQISKSLSLALSYIGFEVSVSETLADSRARLKEYRPDIFLLDVNLPDGNGLDFCHELREAGVETPIVFLSARTDEETVVRGMNVGADDYLRKPFGIEELKARMARAMRRGPPPRHVIEWGPIRFDVGARAVTIGGKVLSLGRREYDIFAALCEKKGDVVTRETILNQLGDNAELYDRTIDSHISHLRRKLRDAAGDSVQITPVYGVGYRLHKA